MKRGWPTVGNPARLWLAALALLAPTHALGSDSPCERPSQLCPGATNPQSFKVSNNAYSWLVISGIVTCRDGGDSYIYNVDFLHFHMNRDLFNLGTIHGNWFGLAIYNCDAQKTIEEWMYDDARPINLDITTNRPGLVGKLIFTVPKAAIGSATGMTFYTTFNGSAQEAWFR